MIWVLGGKASTFWGCEGLEGYWEEVCEFIEAVIGVNGGEGIGFRVKAGSDGFRWFGGGRKGGGDVEMIGNLFVPANVREVRRENLTTSRWKS